MKSFLALSTPMLLALLPLLAGCGQSSKATLAPVPSNAEKKSLVIEDKKDDGITLSAVETNLMAIFTIPPAERTATMRVEEEAMLRNGLAMCTVTLQPPPPASLKMSVLLQLTQPLDFTDSPMLIRGRVYREKEAIYTFSSLITNNEQLPKAPATNASAFLVDGFLGLASIPDTLLFHVEVEVCFLPKETDPATFNPDAPVPDKTIFGHILSNPLRVNLLKEQSQ